MGDDSFLALKNPNYDSCYKLFISGVSDFLNIISALVFPVGIILLGCFTRRFGWFRTEADASLATLTIRLLYPCFILRHLVGHEALREPTILALAPIAGFLAIVVGFGFSLLVARAIGLSSKKCKSFTFTAGIFNYGFFAFPVGQALFGEAFVGKLIIFNLGVEIAIWSVGVMLLIGGGPSWRRLVNPPAIAISLAFLLSFVGGREGMPSLIFEIVDALASCAIPVGLLLIGGSVWDLLREKKGDAGLRVAAGAGVVRLMFLPALFMAIVALASFPNDLLWLRQVLVVQAAMPAGVFAIVIVKSYECDTEIALRVIIATFAGCLITMPFWLSVGIKILSP